MQAKKECWERARRDGADRRVNELLSAAYLLVSEAYVLYGEAEGELIPWLQENDVMIQAWRPLRGVPDCALLDSLCAKYAKSKAQIALNWLIRQKNVVTIAASASGAHLRENLEAAAFALAPSDQEKLTREFPERRLISEAVPLR